MRAAGVRRLGGPVEALDLPGPRGLRADEVLLEVRACGVGNWDEFVRSGGWDTGARPPMALGVEASGIVTAAGSRLAGLAAQGALTVSVARPLALEQAGQALAQVRHGTRGAPVILRPAGPR